MFDPEVTRISGERLRFVLNAAENGMLIVDDRGIIEIANAAAERLFGIVAETLQGRSIDALDCAELRDIIDGTFAPEPCIDPLGVSALRRARTARSGEGTLIHIAARLMPEGGAPRALVIVRAAAVSPETPAAASDDRSGEESRHFDEGRWRYDLRSGALTWSEEVYRIYGLSPADPLTVGASLAGYDAADRERVVALFERAITDGTPYRDQARIVRPDGSARDVVHDGSVERDSGGQIVAIGGFFQDITERMNVRRERQRLNDYVMLANQAGKIGIWELDLQTSVSTWDRNMYALYGLDDPTIVPNYELWMSTLHPEDRDRAAHQVSADIAEGAPSDSEFRVIWQNGEIHTIRSIVTVVCDAAGSPTRIIGTDWDVTEIRSLGEQLREEKDALVTSEARYRALTEALPQMVWVMDATSRFEYVNARWTDYTGCSLEGSQALGLDVIVESEDAHRLRLLRALPEFECEVRLRRSDGAYRWHLVRSVPFSDATGHAGKWIVTATDIEERKAAEKTLASTIAELEHIAHHDPMTDLPNRMRLMERVQHAIAHAQQIHGGVAVLYIDLDRFKAVNDSLGHAAGDEVLRQTGRRILASLRDGDIASRVGGDEFVVVCGTTRSNDDGSRVAARILAAVTEPIVVAGERVAVEACIGVSVFPADGNDADSLIRCADTAMYAAKQSGRNTYRRFNNEAHADALAAAAFEAELRHALSAEQLVVYYQPIIDLNTMRPHAAEALVRWHHPQRGLLAPGEFIAFAEERGLIAQIGAFVMEQACAMLGRLPQMGAGELRIGINVSAHEFSRDSFIPAIMAVLKRYSLDARQLTVEITESVMMGDTRATMATLDQLRKLGVYLSVDDFGTGYSSLAYIKRFPISTLKIDRSFVRDIAEDKTDQAIAKTIITLAHSLGMRVVAEGVETQAQLEQLESFEVDSVQGFLFSRPLAPADFEDYVKMWYSDRSPGCEAKPLLSPER